MTVNRGSLQDIVDRVHTIPSIPEVVTQVVRLVNNPNSSAEQVSAAMIRDPGMAAKMLRVANSVASGLTEPVYDLSQAVPLLGFKTIRSIALSVSVINAFQAHAAGFDMHGFWTHATVIATISRTLAVRARLADPELAFVVGLLKDVGMLILVEWAPEVAKRVLAVAREFHLGPRAAARRIINTDHAEIGAWLCERWGLDGAMRDGVLHQDDIAGAKDPKLASITVLAEQLCFLKKIRFAGQCDEPVLDPVVWRHLSIDKAALRILLPQIDDEIDKARKLMEIAQS